MLKYFTLPWLNQINLDALCCLSVPIMHRVLHLIHLQVFFVRYLGNYSFLSNRELTVRLIVKLLNRRPLFKELFANLLIFALTTGWIQSCLNIIILNRPTHKVLFWKSLILFIFNKLEVCDEILRKIKVVSAGLHFNWRVRDLFDRVKWIINCKTIIYWRFMFSCRGLCNSSNQRLLMHNLRRFSF